MTKTKRIFDHGLLTALALAWMAAACLASDPRETPLVRAVKRAREGVINIHSEKTAISGDSLFAGGKSRKINGMGTGIVIDERGYIATNFHVVDRVNSLRVTLDDGSTYVAHVISYDRSQDLAIIKINASKRLTVIPIGTSSDLMLGETVVAVGNAFGYEHTVTSGIVSSLSRDVEVNEKQSYKNLIQTDASINPGNSGGPLLNLRGEVVGINVAIRAGAQRIGFAIPIDEARKVIANLLSIEQLNQTYHGLHADDVKNADERKLVVNSTAPESPAAAAGFQAGDVVVKAGSVDVVDRVDFERALLGKSVGDEIEIIVRRDSKEKTLTLKLSPSRGHLVAQDNHTTTVAIGPNRDDGAISMRTWRMFGLKLADLSGGESNSLGSHYRGGMRVIAVRHGSSAESNDIREGDILVGLHVWETLNHGNVAYVLDHKKFGSFNPLKFFILRGRETLFGHLQFVSSE